MTQKPTIMLAHTVPPSSRITSLAFSIVQGEWEVTVARIQELTTLVHYSELVDRHRYAHIAVPTTADLEAVERVLFENLLLAPRARTVHEDKIEFVGEWRWWWRKSAPYLSEHIGKVSSMAPWIPRNQWSYRYNEIDADE